MKNKNEIKELDKEQMDKHEDEWDLKCAMKALKEIKNNPKTYTLKEVKKELFE